jgi:CheY-like chemotaxis protein
MKRKNIYYIDEAEVDLRTNTDLLNDLFSGTEITIQAQLPFPNPADYNPLIANATTAAFILDQRMKGSGLVNYNGTDLAAHLRTLNPKLPIYILTGYATEQDEFRGAAYRVEYIIDKKEIQDTTAESAQIVKARMLRRVAGYNDVMDEREQRFHDLLVKSLHERLTEDEQREMNKIEGETTAPILAAERDKERKLGDEVDKLRKLLDGGHLPM